MPDSSAGGRVAGRCCNLSAPLRPGILIGRTGPRTMPAQTPPSPSPPERQVLRPSQLNALARDLLEGSFPMVWVEAEISNLSRPASGHVYFTLKDARAQVRCALFRQTASRLAFAPANGQQVLARGRLTLYEPRGDYQLVLDHMEPAGEGALRAAFEALKARLAAEGLFEPSGKPALPRFVRRLGVVTSPRGAAVRDVISVITRRFPLLAVDVLPVPVQGEGAAAEILHTLQQAAASGRYDALLLTRGGGSLEDLWAFNDEALVRWLASSTLPVVAAVGHEIDTSLAEFAAALRAATPSAAAELLVPDRAAIGNQLDGCARRLDAALRRHLASAGQGLDRAVLRLQSHAPRRRLERGRERLDNAARRLRLAIGSPLDARRSRLARCEAVLSTLHPRRRLAELARRLQLAHQRQRVLVAGTLRERRFQVDSMARAMHAVGPLATLERGYAILREEATGSLVRSCTQLHPGQRLAARLADGEVLLEVVAGQTPRTTSGGVVSGTGWPKR